MNVPMLASSGLIVAGLIIFMAGVIKGTVGMGFPLVAVPLMANLIGPHPAVVVVAVPSLVSNVYLFIRGRRSLARAGEFGWVLIGLILGVVLGARAMRELDAGRLSLVLGLVAVAYAAMSLIWASTRLTVGGTPGAKLGVGVAAGLLGGTTAVFAPVLASYLDGLRLARDEFVFWITALFLVGGVTQVSTFIHLRMYQGWTLGFAVLLCVPMFIGAWAGIRIRGLLSADRFRVMVLLVIMASGLSLVARGLLR